MSLQSTEGVHVMQLREVIVQKKVIARKWKVNTVQKENAPALLYDV